MKSRIASVLLSFTFAAGLAGCGMFDSEERDPWRAQAEAACFAKGEVKLTTLISEMDEIEGKGVCGLDRPLRVKALTDGSVELEKNGLVMSCPMVVALERWVRNVVQPAAYQNYGVPVVEIRSMGTYNCRTRNNVPGARLSEHAFANAFDFSGAVLANGHLVTVRKGWRGAPSDQAFLRAIHGGACQEFTTVLGPGSDGMHENHLHLDLARHNAKGTYRYCKPKPQLPKFNGTPVHQPLPQDEIPVAEAPQVWPRVLPETIAAHETAAAQPAPPLTASPVESDPAASAVNPVFPQQAAPLEDESAFPEAQPTDCPPGYICTPTPNQIPPPIGWSVGPQPVQGYSPDVTGSLPPIDE